MLNSPRLPLAHLPTPLWHHPQLDALVGSEVWVKRDDMTGGAEAGNKLRKLEYLLADAKAQNARAVITCGGIQSNHARATALCARQVGLRPVLFLRTAPGQTAITGNLLLDHLADAEIRFITAEQYRDRNALMAAAAREMTAQGEPAYVIAEGGSSGLGALGYVQAAAEIRQQIDLGHAQSKQPFSWVVCACGSGGTAAGLALGAKHSAIAQAVRAFAVCDSAAHFTPLIAGIMAEARTLEPSLGEGAPITIDDSFIGPGYGVMNDEQRAFLKDVAGKTGLVVDPVYSGKALFGLAKLTKKPDRVLFVHTGGLPGLLAQAKDFSASVSAGASDF